MTQEEFKIEVRKIYEQRDKRLKEVREIYAFSNNKISVGDIFKDHMGYIKVEKIQMTIGSANGIPYCTYYGTILKKDLSPIKSGDKRYAWQINAVSF